MIDRTKAYVLWQGHVSTEKFSCEARLIDMHRKEHPLICELLDKDALGAPAWREKPDVLEIVMAVALITMREALDAHDIQVGGL